MNNSRAPLHALLDAPTGADDWQHRVREDYDRWLAMMPNAGEIVLNVYERAPGAWVVVVLEEGDPVSSAGWDPGETDLALDHAAPLPAGPFASAEEAMRAADAWCQKWAPRVVDLPGLYALRICTDGKIRTYADESDADHLTETELTPEEARAVAEVLTAAAEEVGALPAEDCTA